MRAKFLLDIFKFRDQDNCPLIHDNTTKIFLILILQMNWPSGPRPPPAQWLRTRSTWWPPPTTSTSPSSCRSFPTSQRYASASRSSLEICRIHNYTSSCKMSSEDRTGHFAIAKIEELFIKKTNSANLHKLHTIHDSQTSIILSTILLFR